MGRRKTGGRSRGWCLTINNYTDEMLDIDIDDTDLDYLILGKEVGKKGTKHLQGFCYCKNKISFERVKQYFPTAHIERQKGTLASAIVYCMKDGVYREYGVRPRQGKRTDLDIIKEDIKKSVIMVK
jgi:Putative viral replication protein.